METEKIAAAAELALKRIKELEAEIDRLRAALAGADADRLAAVKRAIEAAAIEAWNREPDDGGPIECAIRALHADEIARGEG